MIEGVKVKTLKIIPDERGKLMEILRSDEDLFRQFGQLYMTTAYPGIVKGWHYHKIQYDNFTCVGGTMKLVLYDARKDSPTHQEINEFFVGLQNPLVVQIPPWVYHGFMAVGNQEVIVINVPTECYHHEKPDEFRVPSDTKEIPYDWSRIDG